MPRIPELSHILKLATLPGEPRVSFPHGDPTYPVTERAWKTNIAQRIKPFYDPEPDQTRYPGCVLTAQAIQALDHQDAAVYRRYERLPSPKKWQQNGWNQLLRRQVYRAVWSDRATSSPPAVGGRIQITCGGIMIPNAIVLNSGLATSDNVVSQFFVEACQMPTPYTERVQRAYTFPALFRPISGWEKDGRWMFNKPWLGTHYDYIPPRQKIVSALVELSFSIGQTNALPEIYQVTTRAQLSRAFPQISANTIHQAFSLYEYLADGTTALIERFGASSPPTYNSNQTLIIAADEQQAIGPLWVKRVFKAKEQGTVRAGFPTAP